MRTEGIDFEVMDIEERCQNRGEKKTTGQAFGVILLNSLRGRFQVFGRTSVSGAKEENLVL